MKLYPNWNSKGIGSILLPYGILEDLAKFIFYDHHKVYGVMIISGGTIEGINKEKFKKYQDLWKDVNHNEHCIIRFYHNPNYGKEGDRNVHQFTGRTV